MGHPPAPFRSRFHVDVSNTRGVREQLTAEARRQEVCAVGSPCLRGERSPDHGFRSQPLFPTIGLPMSTTSMSVGLMAVSELGPTPTSLHLCCVKRSLCAVSAMLPPSAR